MKYTQTKIKGVYIITIEPREDSRGYFSRVFAKEELKKQGIPYPIVHINRSLTHAKGTIRGIHYQTKPYQEDKIIQCLSGRVFDVAVDIRRTSPTFGKWVGIELSENNKKMILIPRGCAHGFQTLEDNCLIEYFVTQYYSPSHERGIVYNDPHFAIKWPIRRAILSEKDQNWPLYEK